MDCFVIATLGSGKIMVSVLHANLISCRVSSVRSCFYKSNVSCSLSWRERYSREVASTCQIQLEFSRKKDSGLFSFSLQKSICPWDLPPKRMGACIKNSTLAYIRGRMYGRMVTLLPKFNASFLTHGAPLHAKAQHRNKSVNTGKTDKCSLRTWDYLPPSLPERLTWLQKTKSATKKRQSVFNDIQISFSQAYLSSLSMYC